MQAHGLNFVDVIVCCHVVTSKTVTKNWVIEAPSVGTNLAYLETTAYIICL